MKVTYNPGDVTGLRDQTAAKLNELLRERQDLDRRILSLKQSLRAFETYLEAERDTKSDKYRMEPVPLPSGLEGLRELGLTDAVRKIIQSAIEPMNAKQIRDTLGSFSYRKLPKTNPLAAIHAVLTRLEKNEEIRPIKGSDKKPAYEWRSQIADLVDSFILEGGRTFENALDDIPRKKK